MNKKIELYSYAYCGAELHFTSLEPHHDATIELGDYAGVDEYDGMTYVSFYTCSEDCPTDCIKVKESVEEVKMIVNEALDELAKFRNTVTTVDKAYLESLKKMCKNI